MAKHKTKYIFECTAAKELTQFNREWNKGVEEYCERDELFTPLFSCMHHGSRKTHCKYLKIHKYKGDK